MSEFSQQIAQITTYDEYLDFIRSLSGNRTRLSYEDGKMLRNKYDSMVEELSLKGELPLPSVAPASEVINRIRNSGE